MCLNCFFTSSNSFPSSISNTPSQTQISSLKHNPVEKRLDIFSFLRVSRKETKNLSLSESLSNFNLINNTWEAFVIKKLIFFDFPGITATTFLPFGDNSSNISEGTFRFSDKGVRKHFANSSFDSYYSSLI